MGVKSTVTLTREQAVEMAVMLTAKINHGELSAIFSALDNQQLEDALEEMNDEANGGEGFDNYSIQS